MDDSLFDFGYGTRPYMARSLMPALSRLPLKALHRIMMILSLKNMVIVLGQVVGRRAIPAAPGLRGKLPAVEALPERVYFTRERRTAKRLSENRPCKQAAVSGVTPLMLPVRHR